MKTIITKMLTIAFFLSSFGCAFTNQDKAQKLVKQYLEKNLDDPGSYESVSFGTFKPTYEEYKDTTAQGTQLKKEASSLYKLSEKYHLKSDSIRDYVQVTINA